MMIEEPYKVDQPSHMFRFVLKDQHKTEYVIDYSPLREGRESTMTIRVYGLGSFSEHKFITSIQRDYNYDEHHWHYSAWCTDIQKTSIDAMIKGGRCKYLNSIKSNRVIRKLAKAWITENFNKAKNEH